MDFVYPTWKYEDVKLVWKIWKKTECKKCHIYQIGLLHLKKKAVRIQEDAYDGEINAKTIYGKTTFQKWLHCCGCLLV